MQIRDAVAGDVEAIGQLLADLDYPPDAGLGPRLAQLAEHPDARTLVAADGERLLGLLSLHFIPQLALPGAFCRISYLCVNEGARSLGVGALLESTALRLARERGCDRLEVHCHQRRTRAHGFYARQGYEESPKYLIKSLKEAGDA
ncbi:GNAT family N-acetyltransferase [Stutzerimonas nosocomialis]|uniref:GNAT family N-acetyltransferase n=1 Tax=Stutzerimonas nosocomialis TaxID=1056496 RepID=UPI001108DD0F|nr:GNAT family N-acetyltransferase [Stutzerimonas nosocomialis]TLX58794.1 GNAT family N-acetyltransferase [Stutzerimonas nosocomialis]